MFQTTNELLISVDYLHLFTASGHVNIDFPVYFSHVMNIIGPGMGPCNYFKGIG